MTLFVDVQGVPNAILELVKARILANRKRSKDRAAVKPEQPARRRYYSPVAPDRRPEPAGIPLGDPAWLLVPNGPEFKPIVRGIQPFTLEKIDSGGMSYAMATGVGPFGTKAFEIGSALLPGAPTEPNNYYGSVLALPPEPKPDPTLIKEPRGKSYTLEIMFRVPAEGTVETGETISDVCDAYASFGLLGDFSFRRYFPPALYPVSGSEMSLTIGLPFDADFERVILSSIPDGVFFDAQVFPSLGTSGWQHAAVVQTPGSTPDTRTFSFYWNGQRVQRTPDYAPRIWGEPSTFIVELDAVRIINREFRLHGFRYTPRALYTGATYTPPTSITRLA